MSLELLLAILGIIVAILHLVFDVFRRSGKK